MSPTPVIGIELPPAAEAELLSPGNDLPRLLDESSAAYVVLGAGRTTGGPSLSPTIAATVLARRTSRIGLVVAASPQRDHPYNVARRVASVDHLSGGRAGLLGLPRDGSIGLGIGAGSSWIDGAIGSAELTDALLAIRTLWRTWPIDALDPDPAVARAVAIPYADHSGVFATKGPLNVPTTPQGEPLVFWPAGPGYPADDPEAAAIADVILIDAAEFEANEFDADELDRRADRAAGARLHVRTGTPAAAADLAARPAVDGILLQPRPEELRQVLAELPTPGAGPSGTTLRDRLAIPRRAEPDLSDHDLAFPALTPSQP